MIDLPVAFVRQYTDVYGVDKLAILQEGLSAPQPVSIRINRAKATFGDLALDKVLWCDEGIYLDRRPVFAADPLWHTGVYYVQEAGSMFLGQYLANRHPKIVVDLCAAPGGKSTLLRDTFGLDTLLVCNEPDIKRARILRENLLRWGADECIVTCASPEALKAAGLKADLILVDAPCSGEGMFRKDPDAIREWSPENVRMCVDRQRIILDTAWDMLEDEGMLIYSTCTLNQEENEGQIHWLKAHHPEAKIVLPDVANFPEGRSEEGYRFSPGTTRSEGFTIFGIRKLGGEHQQMHLTHKKPIQMGVPAFLKEALGKDTPLCAYADCWHQLSERGQDLVRHLQSKNIHLLLAGVPLGTQKGNDFVPHQGWVCSRSISSKLPYPNLRIGKKEAIAILKRHSITPWHERGYHLLTYEGYPFCIVKNIGNRVNTLFPKEWAIVNNNLTVDDIPDTVYLFNRV